MSQIEQSISHISSKTQQDSCSELSGCQNLVNNPPKRIEKPQPYTQPQQPHLQPYIQQQTYEKTMSKTIRPSMAMLNQRNLNNNPSNWNTLVSSSMTQPINKNRQSIQSSASQQQQASGSSQSAAFYMGSASSSRQKILTNNNSTSTAHKRFDSFGVQKQRKKVHFSYQQPQASPQSPYNSTGKFVSSSGDSFSGAGRSTFINHNPNRNSHDDLHKVSPSVTMSFHPNSNNEIKRFSSSLNRYPQNSQHQQRYSIPNANSVQIFSLKSNLSKFSSAVKNPESSSYYIQKQQPQQQQPLTPPPSPAGVFSNLSSFSNQKSKSKENLIKQSTQTKTVKLGKKSITASKKIDDSNNMKKSFRNMVRQHYLKQEQIQTSSINNYPHSQSQSHSKSQLQSQLYILPSSPIHQRSSNRHNKQQKTHNNNNNNKMINHYPSQQNQQQQFQQQNTLILQQGIKINGGNMYQFPNELKDLILSQSQIAISKSNPVLSQKSFKHPKQSNKFIQSGFGSAVGSSAGQQSILQQNIRKQMQQKISRIQQIKQNRTKHNNNLKNVLQEKYQQQKPQPQPRQQQQQKQKQKYSAHLILKEYDNSDDDNDDYNKINNNFVNNTKQQKQNNYINLQRQQSAQQPLVNDKSQLQKMLISNKMKQIEIRKLKNQLKMVRIKQRLFQGKQKQFRQKQKKFHQKIALLQYQIKNQNIVNTTFKRKQRVYYQ